jgi:hypothetical protein
VLREKAEHVGLGALKQPGIASDGRSVAGRVVGVLYVGAVSPTGDVVETVKPAGIDSKVDWSARSI